MKQLLILLALTCVGCAAWQAGINDPAIVSHAIETTRPYAELAGAVGIPWLDKAVILAIAPLLILLSGKKKLDEK